jgi:TRAP-type C4-dicarboxylate transport system permease small subunit
VTVDAGSQGVAPAHAGVADAAAGGAAAGRSLLGRLDVSLGALVEMLAAVLVAAEIVILFGGVVSRYVFDRPLVWSDELSSTLFLWLAMLGAVIAFRRDEHMRMTAFVATLGTRMRTMADRFASAASLAFLVLIAWPAYQYAREELPITTSALEITDAWRAAALPAGIGLMIIFAVLRLIGDRSVKSLMPSLAVPLGFMAALVVLFWLGEPVFQRLGNFNLLIFFVGVVAATVFAGVPIAFAFGLAIFGYLALATHTPLTVLVGRMDEGMSHLILLAVPLFVFLGLLIEMTGMAGAMVAFLAWAMSVADCISFLSPECIWFPGSPAQKRPIWRRSHPCFFRR